MNKVSRFLSDIPWGAVVKVVLPLVAGTIIGAAGTTAYRGPSASAVTCKCAYTVHCVPQKLRDVNVIIDGKRAGK